MPITELNYQLKGEPFIEVAPSTSLWQVQNVEDAIISKDYLEQGKAQLRDMFSQDSKGYARRGFHGNLVSCALL